MFSNSRKTAQQTAQRLVAGHFTLMAWWTLRHAGVFDAIVKLEAEGEALNPLVYATRTSMSSEVLAGLFEYLAHAGLVAFKNEFVTLTSEGKALLEHEDGVLELIRAYQPVLDMSEHLLAKLKTYGSPHGTTAAAGGGGMVYRKSEYLLESQAKRYGSEVYPAVQDLIEKHRLRHLLDLSCGTGELLIHLAKKLKNVVGVGIGADSMAVRRANAAIGAANEEKRFIAVAANPLEVCTETQRTFDRIGVSRQLWNEMDCLIATTLFSEAAGSNGEALPTLAKTLGSTRRNFPKAHLLLIEAVDTPKFYKNYYAPELALLLRLSKSTPWSPAKWREGLSAAKYSVVAETLLTMDGLALFLCKPA